MRPNPGYRIFAAALLSAYGFASFSAGQTPAPASLAEPDSTDVYVLQRGDELDIRVLRLPELSQECTIRPDGKISLLLLNDVEAAGLTPTALSQKLTSAYAAYYRDPQATVIVRSFSKMNVFVGGEVKQPGGVPLSGDMTALGAVIRAGGLKETGKNEKVLLLRGEGGGKREVVNLDLDAVVAGQAADLTLRPSDVVYVPKTEISVYVGGEVTRPGVIPLNGELTALAAIFQAGGFRETAKTSEVLLLRNGGKDKPIVAKLTLDDVMKGKPDSVLRPYDILFVPKSRIAKVDKFVDQYIRQLIPLNLSAGFSYIAGGTVVF